MSEYTEGPWKATDGIGGSHQVVGPSGSYERPPSIADVWSGEANARFIAAAPELLEAAEALANDLEKRTGHSATDNACSTCSYLLQLRAAIAKARGES